MLGFSVDQANMSATEIIEELQKLPDREQEEVLAFLLLARERRKNGEAQVKYAVDAEFEKVADKVFREHAELFRRLSE